MSKRLCPACRGEVVGRADKKFCDAHCKSAYQYRKVQEGTHSFYARVDRQLKINRRILKHFNKAGKATARSEILLEQGFNPHFFTHYWKNKQGDVYLFVYEFGFLTRPENGKKKFILITWQPYMENKKGL